MEFTQKEILEILEKLGYQITQIPEEVKSRKTKLFGNSTYYAQKDGGERLEARAAFKKELINKIFKL